jgi:hypothetical protein
VRRKDRRRERFYGEGRGAAGLRSRFSESRSMEEDIMSGIDPTTLALAFLALIVAGWSYVQVRSLSERLTKLEKEYLALVEELETRMYTR